MRRPTKIASHPPLIHRATQAFFIFGDASESARLHISTDFLNKRDSTFVAVLDERVNLCGSLFQAYVQLIEHFGWKSYTILYEDNQGLAQYQKPKIYYILSCV